MSLLSNRWSLAALVVLCWALIASSVAGYYYMMYSQLEESYKKVVSRVEGTLITVNLGIDYGNGTRVWFNGTDILIGMTLFDVTKKLTNLSYSVTAQGVFVNSINGVENAYPYYWMWWSWNGSEWSLGEVGADSYTLKDGDILLWYYQDISYWPPSKPQ